jgi:site-specific DNA-methyltransferase (adenine-specific)
MNNRTIYKGDVLEKLLQIPDNSIDCIITSPPYWALRDYGDDGQWGLEKDPKEWLQKMKLLMVQLYRVLKETGTCWINLGDTYGPDKSRFGIPERFYINCIESGWIGRNVIPWIKWNSMPQSVKDRFTNKWEYIYFFSKSPKYYFNLDAVRRPVKEDWKSFNVHVRDQNAGRLQTKLGELVRERGEEELKKYNLDGTKKQDRKYSTQTISKINNGGYDKETGKNLANPKGKNPGDLTFEEYSDEELLQWIKLCKDDETSWQICPPDLFFINPKPMKEAHFATFPIALPQRILKCACPKEVCVKCGVPKIPISGPTDQYQKLLDNIKKWGNGDMETGAAKYKKNSGGVTSQHETVGYLNCECKEKFIPGIVLDPFFGAGTTGVAAEKENLHWCGIELKEEYITIAKKRLEPYMGYVSKFGEYLV